MSATIINMIKSVVDIDDETIKEIDRIMEKYGYDVFDSIATAINILAGLYVLVQALPLIKKLAKTLSEEKH